MSGKKSGSQTLLWSVIMSSPGPLVVGLGLLVGQSSTQIADFVRRSSELLAIIVAFFCLSFFGSYAMMLPMMGGMLGIFGPVGLIDANIVSMGALQGFALIGAGLLLVIVAVTALNMLLAFLSKELLERKLNVT